MYRSTTYLSVLIIMAMAMAVLVVQFWLSAKKDCATRSDAVNIVKEGWFLFRNERRYEKGNIAFFCNPIRSGYSGLIIGSPKRPYAGDPPIVARFPNNEIVNLAQVTTQSLMKCGFSMSDVSGEFYHEIARAWFRDEGPQRWPPGTWKYAAEYWSLYVKNGTILAIFVYGRGEGKIKPAIGKSEAEMYSFPLTQDQVIRVFGTPDVIREYFSE